MSTETMMALDHYLLIFLCWCWILTALLLLATLALNAYREIRKMLLKRWVKKRSNENGDVYLARCCHHPEESIVWDSAGTSYYCPKCNEKRDDENTDPQG